MSYRGNQSWQPQQGRGGHQNQTNGSYRGNYGGRNSSYQGRNRYDEQSQGYRNGQQSYNQGGQYGQQQQQQHQVLPEREPFRQRLQRFHSPGQAQTQQQHQQFPGQHNQQFQRPPNQQGQQNNYGNFNRAPNNASSEGDNRIRSQPKYSQQGNGSHSGGRDSLRNNYSNFYNSYNTQQRYSGNARNQLWMGDIDPLWDDDAIMNIWKSVGFQPISVKIMRDRNSDKSYKGKSDYCFVSFSDATAMQNAIQKNGLQIPDTQKVFKLNWTNQGNQQGDTGGRNPNSFAQGGPSTKQKAEYSLFVGDLGVDVTDQILYESFDKVFPGQILLAKVMLDPATRLSKGFGFVKVASQTIQNRSITEMNGTVVGGRQIRVGLASGGAGHASGFQLSNSNFTENDIVVLQQHQPALNQFTDPNNTTLVVRGLSSKVSEDELGGYFIAFGDIVFCKLTYDLNTGYVKFLTREAAENAILYMHGITICGCRLVVTWGFSNGNSADEHTEYQQSAPPPRVVGKLGATNIFFNKLTKEQAQLLELVCENEPLPVSQSNKLYISRQSRVHTILEEALL